MAALVAAAPAAAQTAQQKSVEAGLLPSVAFDGREEAWTIESRMTHWKVPGVSVAVIEGGRIVWARGYGAIASTARAKVTPRTRFQAASISKPVAAAAALSLVGEGKLSLDADVNAQLTRWKLPASAFTATTPVTLRHLLSHTGGTTVHGFPGYAQGQPVPSLVQLLSGTAPANTPAVVSEAAPGARWKYSGGGYQIVQLLIEEASGRAFAEAVAARVLRPARMADSGYGAMKAGSFAFGHDLQGRPIPGNWHSYPEGAAAGLWTTPSDLARFGLALAAAMRGQRGALLGPEMTRAMTTPVQNDYGLGPGVKGEGDALMLSHGGANEGFRAFWVIYPRTGKGAVVMTNADGGAGLATEILRGVSKVHGWPDYKRTPMTSVALAPDVYAAREGSWIGRAGTDDIRLAVRREGNTLVIASPRGTYAFTPTSATQMVAAANGATVTFPAEPGPDGKPQLRMFGLTYLKE